KDRFDYRDARTWGIKYESRSFSTMASIRCWTRNAAEVAGAAMTLAQALKLPRAKPCVEMFNDFDAEVVQALARVHATCGDANEALAWAKQVGSGGRVAVENDWRATWGGER